MKYFLKSLPVKDLIALIDREILDLSPSYQREYIWSLSDQKELINTIYKKYPLPNLFFNVLDNGNIEMVDGQQRSRTIYRHYKNEIKFAKKDIQQNIQIEDFLNYEIPVVYIEKANPEEIREFYVLINKKGKFLNNPEVQRSEFQETKFLKLSEKLTSNQQFVNLDLFTNTAALRLNDRDFVQELLGYLLMSYKDVENNVNEGYEGIRDKKQFIDKEIFQQDISELESEKLESNFKKIINKITFLDEFKRINSTRYRQRNDFYTLFNFINKHVYLSNETLLYQYRILLEFDGKDTDGYQFIRPTNEDCEPFKKYAQNCVSQSNSKIARRSRLDFFENTLLNKAENINENEILSDIIFYFDEIYGEEKISLEKVNQYYLLNIELFNN
ncbi:DUF262 domain-containing protein [Olleya sp. AS48]|uniref:DUF262 domain-containing protein n=1 Tax=Olleya sp. AS48 TaxID=3135774 RepID=UPI00316B1297